MCVPVSIGFGKTALVPARIEYSVWQMCVRERKRSTPTCGISTSGTWLPGEGSAHESYVPKCYVPWDSWSSTYGTLKESGGGGGGGGGAGDGGRGPSAHVHSLEPQHQRYHEEPHKPMDRGDCQGSLHSSWSSLRLYDSTWGPSTVSFMGLQMSDGFTSHPVSSVLEVIWGLPEFIPAPHGLYRWWHVDTGSSGGCTTRSGSRASSPTSIAYTICMQPLLRRS